MTPDPKSGKPRPFWLNALILLAGTSVLGYILSLLMNISLSNVYFIAGTLFLIVAAVPIFTEIGGTARTSFKARREGRQVREVLQEQEESGRYSQGTRITFLFGTCGMICFILAIFTL